MKAKLFYYFTVLVLLAGLTQTASAAVGFAVTPSAVSNTYSGYISLQITGLTNSETVVVQKFLDFNNNGVIDASDWLVQQFKLTDGQPGMVIGGVTNINVPGDLNAADGTITAALNFQNGDFMQNIVGEYLYKLSSPAGHFTPIVRPFVVTNFSFAQSISGTVTNSDKRVAVPGALVILFSGPRAGKPGLGPTAVGGVVADQTGAFTLRVPVGVHELIAASSNLVFNYSQAPVFELSTGQQVATNLALITATNSISGKIVDANDASLGLGGVLVHAETSNSVVSATFTDSNGDFDLPAPSDTLQLGVGEGGLIIQGYVGWENGTNVSIGASPLNISFPKANALIYGNVRDSLGNPLANVAVSAYDKANHTVEVETDTNGNYALGVLAGNDNWAMSINTDIGPTNYLYSYSAFGSTNLSIGQAIQADFIAILATNHISGWLKDDNGDPIAGVEVYASTRINGTYYEQEKDTDGNGNYALNVPNGTYDIGVAPASWGDSDSLPNSYLQPADQLVVISNNNAVANFTATLVNHPKPSLGSLARLPNGQFQFLLTGTTGQNYTIQMSTNLSSTNWTSLFSTNNATTNSFIVVDSHATNRQRFYRVLVGP